MLIYKRKNHNWVNLLKRTVAAQSHFIALIASIIGTVILMKYASLRDSPTHFWACLIFGISSSLVFATSSLYHFLSDGYRLHPGLMKWLENFDHFSIYIFIAGSYTTVLINAVYSSWATILLVAVWTIAGIGILYTHFKPRLPRWAQHRITYTSLFLIMGWLALIRIGEIFENLSDTGAALLVLGGLSYSIGAVIYATKKPQLWKNVFGFHELWHVMVMIGFGFHYFLMLGFYA